MRIFLTFLLSLLLTACAGPQLKGTGDLGLVIERATGRVTLVNTSSQTAYARIDGLGDLSHASAVYSRDGRYAFIFGRDGGLTKIDLLEAKIVKRIIQSGNAIGGSISQDGRIVVAQNYTPGGIKAFDAETLELLSEVPAEYAPGKFSKVVGLADVPGNKFAYALFEGGEIWVTDFSNPKQPKTQRYPAGLQPYDGLVTPDGRHYLAGLFGEDGVALLDLWQPEKCARPCPGLSKTLFPPESASTCAIATIFRRQRATPGPTPPSRAERASAPLRAACRASAATTSPSPRRASAPPSTRTTGAAPKASC